MNDLRIGTAGVFPSGLRHRRLSAEKATQPNKRERVPGANAWHERHTPDE